MKWNTYRKDKNLRIVNPREGVYQSYNWDEPTLNSTHFLKWNKNKNPAFCIDKTIVTITIGENANTEVICFNLKPGERTEILMKAKRLQKLLKKIQGLKPNLKKVQTIADIIFERKKDFYK